MKKIYIAGPISNNPDFKTAFQDAKERLQEQNYIVLDPSMLPAGLEQHEYMSICIPMLYACDEIYMLNNWKSSVGASIEHSLANQKGMEIIYEPNPLGFEVGDMVRVIVDTHIPSNVGTVGEVVFIDSMDYEGDIGVYIKTEYSNEESYYIGNWGDILEKVED